MSRIGKLPITVPAGVTVTVDENNFVTVKGDGNADHQKWVTAGAMSILPSGSNNIESACNAEMWVRSLGWEHPLEEGMATHSSILAWRIPWTEEPSGYTVHGVTNSWDTTER